jgi:L-ascorbate metabolism protein UlaG (beta-lactamase superfamily)
MKVLGCFFCLALFCHAQAQNAFDIHYLGNMGVAIIKNDSVILIDALHDYYDTYYLPTDTTILSKIRNHVKPYQTLVAILATHNHNDHFDEVMITDMGKRLPDTKVVMGKQPAQSLQALPDRQLKTIDQSGSLVLNNSIRVSMKNIGHSGERHKAIENYRIEITWGKLRFVHLGDAAASSIMFDDLKSGADVAIVPNWLCYDEQDIAVLEKQNFKKIIATHIEPSGLRNPLGKSEIEIIPFVKYGQRVSLN